jgi:Fic family protein
MRELLHAMFLPEYTITNKTLNNIAQIDYNRALIETTPILPNWEKQLRKEAKLWAIYSSLRFTGNNLVLEDVKRFVDGLSNNLPQIGINLSTYLESYAVKPDLNEFDENVLKEIHKILNSGVAKAGVFRKRKVDDAIPPDEILAEIVELSDWYHSLDAKETHPIVRAGVVMAKLENIVPFDNANFMVSNLAARIVLKNGGYQLRGFYDLEDWFYKTQREYEQNLYNTISEQEFTSWLEYFTEGLNVEFSNLKEKVLLLARDTKVAKVSGRVKLTERQERIIEHLQDYGILKNKDFPKIFPGKSEDSILRDLKVLINKGIIVKTGSTKASRYELT